MRHVNDEDLLQEDNKLEWHHYILHGGYYILLAFSSFFSNPFKKRKTDLNLLKTIQLLLVDVVDIDDDDKGMSKCRQFIYFHRIVENTMARRRLEKWASRVIVYYLIIVLLIIICNYITINPFSKWVKMSIEPAVMITILSTTTVNIIGLGLIVLRGHFMSNDHENIIKEQKESKSTN